MPKFPIDVPKSKVIKTFELLGFELIKEREHIGMIRKNADGTLVPLTMPNHTHLKGSTLRTICNQSGISRNDFLKAYQQL